MTGAAVDAVRSERSFAYLNADFEGLATVESFTPWGYDFSILTIWASTVAGTAPPAAITLWASAIDP